ncbi:hypothetical protein E3N88_07559 [Mikania micrantha]|uniref:Protein kinase domain-containing protein n=1 Tax=Mikania micrantha TaxID=192012 RepID=A0A5N6PRU8_9ASTR|nr:hypothetical protein E3N88_07559 [Mikania micrantha]
MLIILACFAASSCAVRTDIDCLRSIKESLEDPEQLLSSWDFNNSTEGFICRFTGVECWHPDESRVLNIRLPDMGLRGSFPIGIRSCTSLTGLDLSGNKLTGQLPSNLTDVLQFVTSLDLSNNSLSGSIPPSIANLSYISLLRLNNNQFTGQIPPEMSKLERIMEFSVANNRLSGQVPIFDYGVIVSKKSYANNLGLCGAPLSPCKNETHLFTLEIATTSGKEGEIAISSGYMVQSGLIPAIGGNEVAIGEPAGAVDGLSRRIRVEQSFSWRSAALPPCRSKLFRLERWDLVLAVKRLHKFESFEKEFSQEIIILGRLRHTNLVPLVSFCFEMEKKFLVYKYMSNGTLYQWIHSKPQVEGKKIGWTLRLRIAVGIAQGLAWLHHNNILQISNFGNSIILSANSTISSGCDFVVPQASVDPYKEDIYSFGILLFEIISGEERPSA